VSDDTKPTPQTYGLVEVERSPVVTPGKDGGYEVVAALLKVMGALPNIGKDDKSPEGYSYRGIEAINRHVQQLFAEHGVLPVPRAEIVKIVPSPAMKDGWQDVIMRVEWFFVGLDGSTISAVTNGVGRDRSDKGSNKAQTQSLKYLLNPVLLIADGKDDGDSHSDADGRPDDRDLIPAKDAKGQLLAACGGDKDAATNAWHEVGLNGRRQVSGPELAFALSKIAGGNGTEAPCDPGTPSDAEASTEAPVPPVPDQMEAPF
jgi:hypothetical protein